MSVSPYYFAYGSNMNPERMRARGLPFADYCPARLPGYALAFNKRAHNKSGIGYANIERRVGAEVEGVLYRLESDADLLRMDRYEGTPVRYSREIFAVVAGSETVPAWVYVANPAYIASALRIEQNYINHLLAAEGLLSPAYQARLRDIEALPAPDGAGSDASDSEHRLRFNV